MHIAFISVYVDGITHSFLMYYAIFFKSYLHQ